MSIDEMASLTSAPTRAGKYVTFQISRRYFAIEARRVRSVAPAKDVLPLEHELPFVRGALPMRGRRIPVIDIRDRLGLPWPASHRHTAVILIDIDDICGLPCVGIVADRTSEIVEFRDRDFRDNVIQVRSYGRPYGRPKLLFDPTALLTAEELASLKSIF